MLAPAKVWPWEPGPELIRDSCSTRLRRVRDNTGGNRRLWQGHALVPKLGLFEGREDEIPYDVDDLLVNIAPRARLIVAPKRDRTANITDIEKVIERVEEQGSASSLTFRAPDDRLRFQKDQHETFIRWLNALWSGSRRGQ